MAWTTPNTVAVGDAVTASMYNTYVRDNTNELYVGEKELVYATGNGDLSTAATTIATGLEIFSDQTFTADGSRHLVELFIPGFQNTSAVSVACFELTDGSTNGLGRLAHAYNPVSINGPIYAQYYYTPTAGSVTINVRAFVTTGNIFVYGGVGGSGTFVPRFLRVTRAKSLA